MSKKKQNKLSKSTNKTVDTTTKVLPKLIDLSKSLRIPTLKLGKQLQADMQYLHWDTLNDEWSGTLLYKFENSEINLSDLYDSENKEEIVILANKFLLRDIGTSGATEFELSDEEVMEQMEYMSEGYRTGLIHTHHNMGAYFSGVDDRELQTNTPNHEMYLSLVVDHKCTPVARLCWMGEIEVEKKVKHSFKFLNQLKTLNSDSIEKQEVVFYIDLDVEYSYDEELINKVVALKKKKIDARAAYAAKTHSSYNSWGKGSVYQQQSIGFSNILTPSVTYPEVNFDKDIEEIEKKMVEQCYTTNLDFNFFNVRSFIAAWIANDMTGKTEYWKAVQSIDKTDAKFLDQLEDDLADNFEAISTIIFGEILVDSEILLLGYHIKNNINLPNNGLRVLESVLDDIMIESQEMFYGSLDEAQEDYCAECNSTGITEDMIECVHCDGFGSLINNENNFFNE